ncbi:MAG TPA: cytochrome c [Noviherbaspirillum sp.]|uniref:c-type cytochrome n=1 Tax=Noviherbaspirillum sp. TaxID=1926288 RepID=UPI002D27B3ED|nr:cytochrome c [Noviherbaspirillum sp.]HYD94965.1 cytochrome c [Noviherbaspirillum sp.]
MNRKLLLAAAIAAAAVGTVGLLRQGQAPDTAYIDPADKELVSRGKPVYAQHCAACHGANLEGQPEWRKRRANGRLPAPPHDETGHTWHHPDRVLVDIVKHGLVPGKTAPDGYQSDMPGYAAALSDLEINAVLAYIKSRWPAEVLEMQKNVTLQQANK